MKEFVISQAKAETAVLVGLVTKEQDEAKTKEYLDELEFLADTAGAVTVKRFTQKVGGPSQTTYVGSGKLQEIKQYIKQCQDDYDEWLEDVRRYGGTEARGYENTEAESNLGVMEKCFYLCLYKTT